MECMDHCTVHQGTITLLLLQHVAEKIKRKPDTAKLNLVSSRSNSINVSRLSFPILPSSVSSSSYSFHDSQTIYHAQSTIVPDTDTVFEDIDNSSHDLPEDIDEDNPKYGGSTQSHRARQLKLAEGWSSIRDSILDGMVQQAALPPAIYVEKMFQLCAVSVVHMVISVRRVLSSCT